MTEKVFEFLKKHNFTASNYDIEKISKELLDDMKLGLEKERKANNPKNSFQDMIPTWMFLHEQSVKNENVIVIDAGGTNFRSCLVSFDCEGNPEISDFEKTSMPGVKREFGKKEFFDQIALNLEHLKNKSKRIAFCFSYPMKITPDGEGTVIEFAKEIKASQVVGSKLGEELCKSLMECGWEKPEKVVLLNDTAAALLAGKFSAANGKNYSSYVGFILGTGINAAYVEWDSIPKITKDESVFCKNLNHSGEGQIVVCEAGRFGNVKQSDFDVQLDRTSLCPGMFIMEKQCSGAYLGNLCLIALKKAIDCNFFNEKSFCEQSFLQLKNRIENLEKLDLVDVDKFLYYPDSKTNFLSDIKLSTEQKLLIYEIFDAFIDRSAKLSAGIVASNVLKSKSKKCNNSALNPVCISCDGTTFLKTHKLRERFTHYLYDFLTEKHGIHFEIVAIENPITIGTAMASF
ncbi:MAG: hexokinase [Treponemataceae bacterium]